MAKKHRAALREAYSNREPLILHLNSQEDPCCTAASPPGVIMLPAFSEDGVVSEGAQFVRAVFDGGGVDTVVNELCNVMNTKM
ncbi:hypothetical protein PVAP13_4KG411600 [Panicum virgatum]|uniref:Uncharacterized protein n=1 Tax=Panicum virgatum TaxID=38727 RepID=A0A8T0TU92_PANVG|nr:hypothetical protein PVAP13_4KG411600 [Panicum virgatum]KAG2613647.1 hypothetical protein PVAP13_4KG411600 [Panicum virgatum]